MKHFAGFSFDGFWKESEYYSRAYTDDPLTEQKVALVEARLGYKLPRSYIEFMALRNGGAPIRRNHRTFSPTSWAKDHVAMTGFLSIGDSKEYSLCGGLGSEFMIEEWGYPAIGIYFADCPSAGHDMLCLDFSLCGSDGEPRIVHVDQEFDFAVTHVADSFEQFIRGLVHEDEFPST